MLSVLKYRDERLITVPLDGEIGLERRASDRIGEGVRSQLRAANETKAHARCLITPLVIEGCERESPANPIACGNIERRRLGCV